MAADFPATKKTFTQIVDGTDYTEATQMNQAYDEAEALETFIGAMGRSQAYNTSIKALLKNYRSGCSCIYKSATEITVQAGELTINDASGNAAYRQNTSDTTVGWANIDTGSEANSTVYYVYAIADSAATTFTVLISTSASAPTGGTYYRKIGTFYNDGSGNIQEVADLDNDQAFGAVVTRADNTVYLAITDGFFHGKLTADDSLSQANITVYSDASNPPETVVSGCFVWRNEGNIAESSGNTPSSFCYPVKKGNYYKAVKTEAQAGTTATYYWTPLS